MDYFKTKEIAQVMGVSPTTIKRWAATCPNRFRKDVSGHYIFSSEDLETLTEIQKHQEYTRKSPELNQNVQKPIAHEALETAKIPVASTEAAGICHTDRIVEGEVSMSSPRLGRPSVSCSDTSIPSNSWEDVSRHLYDLEGRLSRKAGDVVNLQVLEHRRELDELRSSIGELACTLDSLTEVFNQMQDRLPAIQVEQTPLKRKFWLGSFL